MNQSTLPRLLQLLPVYKKKMFMSIVLHLLTIASGVGLMATAAWLISKAALQPSIADLGLAPVAVRFFGILRAISRYGERLVTHDVTFRILAQLRVWFYTAVEPLAPARLTAYRSGDLLQRVVADIDELENIYSRVLLPPVAALLTALLITMFFLGFDIWVALISLALMLFTGFTVPLLAWWTGRNPGQQQIELRKDINTVLVDSIQGMADSIAYGHTPAQLAVVRQQNEQLASQETRFAYWDGLQNALTVLLVNMAALLVLIVAIPRVEGIYLATLVLATLAAYEAIIPLGTAMQHLGMNLEAGQRLFEIIDTEPEVIEPTAPSPERIDSSITIKHLTFRYAPEEPPIFQDFNLHIASEEHVAIIGASGRGKSTLMHLLLRFWEYEQGAIRLGGRDLRNYRHADLYNTIGIMTQRTHLFNTTIRENIHLANRAATEEQVIEAAKKAQIHDFILSLPHGYKTIVGETGVNLSGGERQRIALARVLLKDAPIWLLDEATANLDNVTERTLLEAVYTASAVRTLVMVTHRLLTKDHFDRIIRL